MRKPVKDRHVVFRVYQYVLIGGKEKNNTKKTGYLSVPCYFLVIVSTGNCVTDALNN